MALTTMEFFVLQSDKGLGSASLPASQLNLKLHEKGVEKKEFPPFQGGTK